MPVRLCGIADCPELAVYRGRCRTHARVREQGINRAGHRLYRTARWKHTRNRQLANHPLCAECGTIATDVHHRVDLADGGDPWAESNLESLCRSCHSRITRKGQAIRHVW